MFTKKELEKLYIMLSELNVNRETNNLHVKFEEIEYEDIRDMKRKIAIQISKSQ